MSKKKQKSQKNPTFSKFEEEPEERKYLVRPKAYLSREEQRAINLKVFDAVLRDLGAGNIDAEEAYKQSFELNTYQGFPKDAKTAENKYFKSAFEKVMEAKRKKREERMKSESI